MRIRLRCLARWCASMERAGPRWSRCCSGTCRPGRRLDLDGRAIAPRARRHHAGRRKGAAFDEQVNGLTPFIRHRTQAGRTARRLGRERGPGLRPHHRRGRGRGGLKAQAAAELSHALDLLAAHGPFESPETAARVRALLDSRAALLRVADALASTAVGALMAAIHGDFHLGRSWCPAAMPTSSISRASPGAPSPNAAPRPAPGATSPA